MFNHTTTQSFIVEWDFGNSRINSKLSLCVSVVSKQRSFLKLKLIKNYFRRIIGLPRLSDMSMVSIKIEFARNTDDVTNDLDTLKLEKIGF